MAQFRHIFTSIILTAVAPIALPYLIGSASAVGYTMSITTSGNKSINISPRASGVGTSISADEINVATTCRAGYNLAVSTSVNDNKLYRDGNSSNNASGTYFSPADGSTALKSATNTWGYYIDSTAPTEDSVFSAVPASSSTAATLKTPTSSTTDINDTFNVYYGVSVANGMNTGTYKMIPDSSSKDGTIVYYLTMADACTSYTVQYNPTGADNNGTLRTGTGTMADQSIKENIATNLSTNAFTAPSGYYFAGWNTAQDGSGTTYANGQQVTDLASVGQTITLYAQWTDCPSNVVCYDPVATGVTDTMADQSVGNTATTINLWPSNFQRSGYGFAGWNTKADGTGEKYGPMQTLDITAGQYSSGGLHLYAMWIASAGDLQNWSGCSSMNIGDVTALTDNRDGNTYAVAKLADGNCWMIENLRLADKSTTNTSTNATLTTTNTNNPLAVDGTVTLKNTDGTTTDHLSPTTDPTSTAWCTSNSSTCDDQSMLATNNTTLAGTTENSMTGTGTNVYSYGNYYNWYSATAGNGKYENGSGYTTPGDICPAGWQLPIGAQSTATKSFGALSVALGGPEGGATANSSSDPTGAVMSKTFRSYPNNFLYSGNVYGSSVGDRGSFGLYWSSTAYSSNTSYYLFLNSSRVNPGTNFSNKYSGFTARCLIGS